MRIAFVMADKVVVIQRVEGNDKSAPLIIYKRNSIAYTQSTNAACDKSSVFTVERTFLLEIVKIDILIRHPNSCTFCTGFPPESAINAAIGMTA